MASARINYNATLPLGPKIRAAISSAQEARKNLQELARILDKYIDDAAAITTDSGVGSADVALFRNLVTQAANEMAATATTQINVGAASGIRQLVDAMG